MRDGTNNPRGRLVRMSEREFLIAWKKVFGQPPAALLERDAMIDLLLADGPATLMTRERERLRLRAAAWDVRSDLQPSPGALRSCRET